MRFLALCAGLSVSLLHAAVTQAACLKASADDQIAEGRLELVRISIPAYKLKEQAFILHLAAAACLDGTDDPDKVDPTKRIHVFSLDDAMRKRMRGLAGKSVRVRGEPFGEHTIHHHAPIVMRVTAIEPLPKR